MRILIMTNAYEPSISGVVTSIKTFKQALVERGHEVFIFAPEYRHYDDGDPRIQRFPALDLSGVIDLAYALPYRQRMIEAARKISPDIVHAQHPSIMGDRAVDISRALGIPLVATFHCKYDDYARAFLPLLRGLVGNITRWQVGKFVICCNHIIVPAPNVSQWMEKTYAAHIPVSVVPTPLDISLFKRTRRDVIERNFGILREDALLYVGRLSAEKNLDFLIRCMPEIISRRPSTRLVMLGKGPRRRRLYNLARRLGVSKSVVFAGTAPVGGIPNLAASASLFVFSSVVETQALSVIEALAAGTPVVAVDSPATHDVLSKGGGVLVPPDEKAFAETVVKLLNDPRRRQCFTGSTQNG